MACRVRLVLGLAVALAAAPGLESSATALSCGIGPGPLPDPYRDHPLVLEGIPLSGPSEQSFGLASPARVLVLRWVRGAGPRIVRVETALRLGVGPYFGHLPGYFAPSAGGVTRLFAGRARRGVIRPNPCVFGDERPWPRSPLLPIARSSVRAAAGTRVWTARARSGPHGVHCVATHPVGEHTGGQSECELRRPLLAVHHEGRTDTDSTAVTVAGPGIAAVQLRTPDGPIVLGGGAFDRPPGRPFLAVLDGLVEAAEVRARVTMRDGTVRWLQPVGYPTSLTQDPERGRPWYSLLERSRGRTCVGVRQVQPRRGPPGDEPLGVDDTPLCGDLRRVPLFHTVAAARAFAEPGAAVVPAPERHVVFGAAGPSVGAVEIRDPSGVRRIVPGRGGQFVAVYPASIRRADITVTAAP